jgi:hypothetical protein
MTEQLIVHSGPTGLTGNNINSEALNRMYGVTVNSADEYVIIPDPHMYVQVLHPLREPILETDDLPSANSGYGWAASDEQELKQDWGTFGQLSSNSGSNAYESRNNRARRLEREQREGKTNT